MLKNYEALMQFNKDSLDAVVQSGTKLANGFEQIAKEAFSFAGRSFEGAVEAGQQFAACKTPADLMQLQTKLAKDNWESLVAETTKISELSTAVVKAAAEPLQARYKTAYDVAAKAAA
ncbi:phasin family protein [Caenispirillum bisanense]|uniref:Phasin family protein n=1 Tax=Caenispirillum bisanense TaxID=414052 RepID=A0A286G0V9_9PROT|nr:phasin family protein [Caenispirillum bisanense]SOD89108.1 phasin family protein [Caenispirillum bisanense]